MPKSVSLLQAVCFIVFVLIPISCNTHGNPVAPGDSLDPGLHESSGSNPVGDTGHGAIGYTPTAMPHPGDGPDYAPGEVLVTFEVGIVPVGGDRKIVPGAEAKVSSVLVNHGLTLKRVIQTDWGTVCRLEILDGSTVEDKVAEMKSVPGVKFAEPNGRVYFLEAPYFPNDPLWENPDDSDEDPRSTAFEQFGPSKIGASSVWDVTQGEGSVVCVIDTGIQTWHEDLENNMWINEDEIPNNFVDDDENGYVDDIYGWDTDEDDNDIKDYGGGSYHGTGCAGVVASTMDNLKGCTGIAPAARLMGIRIGFNDGFYSAVIEGVEYAVGNGADIVSMSFITTEDSPTLKAAMDDAYASGLIMVGGAGNDDGQYVYYPCSWDSVVKVGATSPFSQAWSYAPIDEVRISNAAGFGWGSTYGNGLEIMAFGEHYITTFGGGADQYWDGADDFFFGGTSNATPMIAAAFALLKAYYPTESAEWLRLRLRETADDLNVNGYDIYTGYGRVNLVRAIYGTDRYAAEEDANGFVDVAGHGGQLIDSLNAATSGDYIDTEDLYKVTADLDGYLTVDLDIYTWGENLDLQIYSDPSMAPEYLVDSSTIVNHTNNSHEVSGVQCEPGQTYYIRVYTAGNGNASEYSISVRVVDNYLSIDSGSIDPGFVHKQCSGKLIGWIELDVGFRVYFNKLIVSEQGSMPPSKLAGIHLYRDSNGNKSFDGGDALIASGNFHGTNRAIIGGFSNEVNFATSPRRYFLTIDLSGITENAEYELVLTSYKDVGTEEGVTVDYSEFPRTFGPFHVGVDIEPPTWDDTVGVRDAEPQYAAAVLRWNSASDPLTPPVVYNVYWTQSLPFDFGTAQHTDAVGASGGGSYDYQWKLTGLNNDEEYFVAVRAEDQAGNEENNTVNLSVTPSQVSDPYAPQVIGSFNTSGNAWEVVTDPDNERVFVADYDGGVLVVDVSDPTNPHYTSYVSAAAVTGVDFDGTYVYAAGSAGLLIINPDGPSGAQLIKQVNFSDALDVCVVGNWVYVSNFGSQILPVDVTDPANPVQYSTVTSGQSGYGMDAENGYLYVATNEKPRVFDLSDPSAPVNTGADFGANYSYEIDAVGDRLYVTYWFNNRFSIYTLSDPAQPSYIGSWTSNSGQDASDLVMFNGYLYFGTNYHHIEVLNVNNPSNIFELGQVSTGGPDGLATDGNFVYSAENEDGLKVIL